MNLMKDSAIYRRIKRYSTYFTRRWGLKDFARENLRLIHQNKDILGDFDKALKQMAAFTYYPISDFINSYKNKAVKAVKILDITLNNNEPIIICAVKDDLIRIKKQVEHHRQIGIRHFVYIDNMSTDGTFEWLESQDDVSLFTVDEIYNSSRRNAWSRQAADFFGYSRWYLFLDSDELFIYPGAEIKPITEYIDLLEKSKIKSTLTAMIDMYTNTSVFKGNSNQFADEYCYFDLDSYSISRRFWGWEIKGGPRKRLYPSEKKESVLLTKYGLIKAEKSDLIGSHNNYPFSLNFDRKRAIAFLLHYKFLPHDDKKYNEIIQTGNYAGGSKEYRKYMKAIEENPDLTFFYDKSVRLNDSKDLLKLEITDKSFFHEFLSN